MSFSIHFTDDPVPNPEEMGPCSMGRITIGDFSEPFVASLDFWNREEYERSWHNALLVVLDGTGKSALITSIQDPAVSNILRWWPMYRFGRQKVIVQEHLLLLHELQGPFSVENPFEHVPPYAAFEEEEVRVSQWETSDEELRAFLSP